MLIVLDANVIIAAGHGRAAAFRFFLSSAKALGYRVCVPALVIEEVVAHFRKDLREKIEKADNSLKALSQLSSRHLRSPSLDFDQEKEVGLFQQQLESTLTEMNCIVLDYPDTSHKEIVKRAIQRKKPFDEHGSGYRDSLIWESMLALASEEDAQMILLSSDKAFSNENGELHIDLVQELHSRNSDKGTVELMQKLSDFIGAYVRPSFERVMEATPFEALADLRINLNLEIESFVERNYANVEWDSYALKVNWDYEGLMLTAVEEIHDIEVVEVREVEPKVFLSEINANLSCSFDVFVPKWEAYEVEELSIFEPDWNKHYVWGSIPVELHCRFDVLVNTSDANRSSIDFLSMEADILHPY